MHQLTIAAAKTVTVTDHDGPDDARAALLNYAVTGDYYLRPVQTTAAHTSYELLRLDDEVEPGHYRHEPRIAGTANIEELAGSTDDSRPDPATLEALRHNAIATSERPTTPAAIAAAVQQHLPAGTSEHQAETLVRYYALILWGATS
jgi:hypothetical protein